MLLPLRKKIINWCNIQAYYFQHYAEIIFEAAHDIPSFWIALPLYFYGIFVLTLVIFLLPIWVLVGLTVRADPLPKELEYLIPWHTRFKKNDEDQ